ncbi:diablo, IAP-binding mitochondrial protein b [Trichomycterus rosablanca]|uniref:diablo, IAP-binding mitochondrial protein b n=1 Tax=Trichomycterus rosablanca TaxID=2290929 RepID=UPI002F35963C
MALYRRKLFAIGSCAASLLSTTNRTRQVLTRLPSLIKRNWISLGISGGLCAVPFVQDQLTHEDLIRRASSLVTDSANTYLSQTTLALVDSFTLYTKAVQNLITLHKSYVENINRLNPADEDAVWQAILRQRQEVVKRRENCDLFESCWKAAINLSKLAADAAFSAGADQASATAQTNLQIAQAHVEQVRQRSLQAEQELKDSKAENSQRLHSSQPAAEEEEVEIPEAYLRED